MLNEALGGLVVYNKAEEILWQIPQESTGSLIVTQNRSSVSYSCVADLNGDGRNEVITTLSRPTEKSTERILRAFASEDSVVLMRKFDAESIRFLGQTYHAPFPSMFPFVLSYPDKKAKEILVAASNLRSPMFVARIASNGTIFGRMWHYGTLGSQYMVDLDGDGNKEMILCGINDADEKTSRPGSVIAVLDPRKIVGETESSATRGFGLEVADCELYYILLPQTDISRALDSRLVVQSMEPGTDKVLRFGTNGALTDDLEQFEFVFSKDMQILDIKPGTWNKDLHDKLKRQGKLTSKYDDRYIADMKGRVKYWNGQRWVSEHVKVDRSLLVKSRN
jgi:hypothetical protein